MNLRLSPLKRFLKLVLILHDRGSSRREGNALIAIGTENVESDPGWVDWKAGVLQSYLDCILKSLARQLNQTGIAAVRAHIPS